MPTADRLITPAFLSVSAATFFYILSFSVMTPVLPLYIEGPLRGGSLAVGAGVGSFALAAVILRPFVGRVGDSKGRHVLMVWGSLVAAVGISGYFLATSLPMLVVCRLFQGAGEAALFVGAATIINDLAPGHRRAEAVSYFSLSVHLGLASGPALGEIVLAGDRFWAVWLLALGLALVATLVSTRVTDTRTSSPPPEGRRRILHPAAVVPGGALCLDIIGMAGFSAFIPLYAREVGLSGSKYLFLMFSGIILVSRLLGARIPDRVGPARMATIALCTVVVGLVIIGSWRSATGLFASTGALAIGMAFSFPALMSLAVGSAPDSERSAVIGTFTAFFDISSGLGAVVLGGVVAIGGYANSFLAAAVISAFGPILLISHYRGRRGPADRTAPATLVPATIEAEATV